MIERGQLVPVRELRRIGRKILERKRSLPMHATQQLFLPRSLELLHHPANERMELVRVPAGRSDLNVLLVKNEQCPMKIGARSVIYPRCTAPIGRFVIGISRVPEIPGQV